MSARIADLQVELASKLPGPIFQQLSDEIDAMVRNGLGAGAVAEGRLAPAFSTLAANGKRFDLHEAVSAGPVVLTFFRGAWCPYCDLTLRAYEQVLGSVRSLNATLVAVSPQGVEQTLAQAENSALTFPVIPDLGNDIARSYGLIYRVSSATESLLRGFGVDLSAINAAGSWELPVPATYVIDMHGTIRCAFIDADYRKRLEPQDLLMELRKLDDSKAGKPTATALRS